jgi:thymidylate synthase
MLTGFLGDVHIYENHIEQVKLMLEREQTKSIELPTLEITVDKPFEIIDGKLKVIWTHKDYILHNYNPWPKIDMGQIAV